MLKTVTNKIWLSIFVINQFQYQKMNSRDKAVIKGKTAAGFPLRNLCEFWIGFRPYYHRPLGQILWAKFWVVRDIMVVDAVSYFNKLAKTSGFSRVNINETREWEWKKWHKTRKKRRSSAVLEMITSTQRLPSYSPLARYWLPVFVNKFY